MFMRRAAPPTAVPTKCCVALVLCPMDKRLARGGRRAAIGQREAVQNRALRCGHRLFSDCGAFVPGDPDEVAPVAAGSSCHAGSVRSNLGGSTNPRLTAASGRTFLRIDAVMLDPIAVRVIIFLGRGNHRGYFSSGSHPCRAAERWGRWKVLQEIDRGCPLLFEKAERSGVLDVAKTSLEGECLWSLADSSPLSPAAFGCTV
jgi:hypothetical protein